MALAECLEPVRHGISLRTPDVLFVRKPQAKVLRRGLAAIVLAALRESDVLLQPLLTANGSTEFLSRRKKIFPRLRKSFICHCQFVFWDRRGKAGFGHKGRIQASAPHYPHEGNASNWYRAIQKQSFAWILCGDLRG